MLGTFGEEGTSGTTMSYILLLVQEYQPSAAGEFLKLEADFEKLEHSSPQFPPGKRYQLVSEGEPTNTLLWKCEFASLEDVQNALKKMANDPTHSALFQKQLPYIVKMRTEIYEVLDLSAHEGPHERA
jgi:hypothetical protein